MKLIAIIILILSFILVPSLVFAAPFLVCDPYPADFEVQGFRGTINGQAFNTPYTLHSSGAAIVYDCSALGPEKWDFVNIRAYNVSKRILWNLST